MNNKGEEEKEIIEKSRALRLDVTNHKAEVCAEGGNEWFEITDDEYEEILKLMKNIIPLRWRAAEKQISRGLSTFAFRFLQHLKNIAEELIMAI